MLSKTIIFIKTMTTHSKNLKKSYDKMQKAIASCTKHYDRCRASRPFFLNVLRHYDDLEGDVKWSQFLRVAYFKVTKEFIPELDTEISKLKELSYPLNPNAEFVRCNSAYLKKFRKNLLKLKKKCEDSSIGYYNYLPGYKLPLDVRSHIIGFISSTNLKNLKKI